MRGLVAASVYWLGLPACTAAGGAHLTQQLTDSQIKQLNKLEPPYEEACTEDVEPPVAGAKLKHVQVLFRHGARTPLTQKYWEGSVWDDCGDAYGSAVAALRGVKDRSIQDLPKMKVFDKRTQQPQEGCIDGDKLVHYPGGCTRGELTKLGQRQAVTLGQWLRHRYVQGGLLPEAFNEDLIRAHSTNYRRTRATMYGVLLGMFPNSLTDMSVQTSTHLEEIMLAQVSSCSQLGAWYKAARAHLAADDRTDAMKVDANKRLRHAMGMPLGQEHRLGWTELHDALTSMRAHGQAIPSVLTPDDLDLIDSLATARIVRTLQDKDDSTVLGLALGRLLQTMEGLIDRAAHAAVPADGAPPQPRLWLWSGHDTTIIPVLLMLGQDVSRWPPYTSSVVLELWEDVSASAQQRPVDERHFVRVLFNASEVAVHPETAAVGEPLSLAQFKEHVLKPYALSEAQHAQRCMMTFEHETRGAETVDTSSIM